MVDMLGAQNMTEWVGGELQGMVEAASSVFFFEGVVEAAEVHSLLVIGRYVISINS